MVNPGLDEQTIV